MLQTRGEHSMTARQSQSNGPFGYQFDASEGDQPSSYHPAGPPLLDNNETDLIQNFFNNPDNLDPAFLLHSAVGGTQTDLSLPYTEGNFDWMHAAGANTMAGLHGNSNSNNPGNIQIAQMTLQQSVAHGHVMSQSQNGDIGNVGVQSNNMHATDDVYAAAQVLHNNQAARNKNAYTMDYSQLAALAHETSRAHAARAETYVYPPVSSGNSGPYNYMATTADTAAADRQQPSAENPHDYTGDANTAIITQSANYKPLRFGSDDGFRTSAYTPAGRIPPVDQTLRDSVTKFWSVVDTGQGGSARHTATETRSQDDEPGTPDGNQNYNNDRGNSASDSEQEKPSARRKRKTKHDGDEDLEASGSPHAKRRHSSSAFKTRKTNSSSRKRVRGSPTESVKAQRENLTEEQKRSNHIQSEQKRRNLIKTGFEDLDKMVPDLRAGGFSKSNRLVEAAKFIQRLRDGNNALKGHIKAFDNG